MGLVTRWKRSGQFLHDYHFLSENLNFPNENLHVLCENLRFSLSKILMIFFMIFFKIHKISYYKIRVSTGSVQTHWLGGNFSVVYKTTLAGWVLLHECVLRHTLVGSFRWFLCPGLF